MMSGGIDFAQPLIASYHPIRRRQTTNRQPLYVLNPGLDLCLAQVGLPLKRARVIKLI